MREVVVIAEMLIDEAQSAAPARPAPVAVAPLPRVRTSPQRLRVPADVTAVMVGLAMAGPGWANVAYAALLPFALLALGTYRRTLNLGVLTELPRLLLATAVPVGMLAPLASTWALPATLFGQAVVTAIALVVARTAVYGTVRSVRRLDVRHRDATLIVVGVGELGLELGRQLAAHPEYGLDVVGYVDDLDEPDPDLRLLGGLDDLEEVIEDNEIRRVLVAFGPSGSGELVTVLRSAVLHDVEVHVVPRFFELGLSPSGPDVEHVWGIPVVRVRRAALRAASFHAKRVIDACSAALLLTVLAPVLAASAVAVKLSGPGPVLFRQRRVGQFGRDIEILKFRTLAENDDADVTWDVKEDPRRTRTGAFLRRTSLDELPQLWNVLRGDMAMVGPRPERPYFVNRFSAQVTRYADRHRLPVGLTGLAQVHDLRGDTSIEERARFDNWYIEHWSPWEDLKIAVLTVLVIVKDSIGVGGRRSR